RLRALLSSEWPGHESRRISASRKGRSTKDAETRRATRECLSPLTSCNVEAPYRVASCTWLGFRLMHRVDGEDRMRVGSACPHFGGDPNCFHEFLFGRAFFQSE